MEVRNAFRGFAQSQKKSAQEKVVVPGRINKFMCHYLRMLYSGIHLLKEGEMLVNIGATSYGQTCMDAKLGKIPLEEVLKLGEYLESRIQEEFERTKLPQQPNREPIERFLLGVRMNGWGIFE